MPSRLVPLATLAGAYVLGLFSTAHADSLAPTADVGTLNMRSLFRQLPAPPVAPAASAGVSPAYGVMADYKGTLILKIEAANRSALPANAKIICSVMVLTYMGEELRTYAAPAQVTPSTVSCSVTVPYKVATATPESTALYVAAFITNTAVTQSNPFPQGFGFVELDPPGIPLPPDGTVTTKTISTIL